jgi:hypothetical protein
MASPDRWDLSAVGLHKRQREAQRVKRLKHAIIQFETRDSELQNPPRILEIPKPLS